MCTYIYRLLVVCFGVASVTSLDTNRHFLVQGLLGLRERN